MTLLNQEAAQTLAQAGVFADRNPVSKHRQFDPETGRHIPGRCRIFDNSSLRKLMRAQRRGAVPSERKRVMLQAYKSALEHVPDFMSGHARRAAGITFDVKAMRWIVPAPVLA